MQFNSLKNMLHIFHFLLLIQDTKEPFHIKYAKGSTESSEALGKFHQFTCMAHIDNGYGILDFQIRPAQCSEHSGIR